jgi:hypothetical protein
MTSDEREASIQRILQTVENTVKTVSDELRKGADMMEPDATHGAAIELLRGAPELAETLGYTVPGLTAAATLLAVELRPEVGSLRDRVDTLWNDPTAMTDAVLTRKLAQLLVDSYREEPEDIVTKH